MMRTRVIKKLSIDPTAKSAVINLNMFIFNILSAAVFKTPGQPHILPSTATHHHLTFCMWLIFQFKDFS